MNKCSIGCYNNFLTEHIIFGYLYQLTVFLWHYSELCVYVLTRKCISAHFSVALGLRYSWKELILALWLFLL